MAKRKKPRQLQAVKPDVRNFLTIEQKGEATTIEVAISKLPVPDRSYSADAAFIRKREDDIQLVFIQCEPLTDRPLTAVTIRYSHQNFQKMVERSYTGTFFPQLSVVVGEKETKEYSPPNDSNVLKSLTERASLERMALSGGDSEIEFYFMPPARLHELRENCLQGSPIQPVLAVTLSSRTLFGLLKQAKRLLNEG